MAAVTAPAGRIPVISGGSAAERTLLRSIVRAMRPTQIRTLTIGPATKDWHPLRPGDVAMMAGLAATSAGHRNDLGEWETWLVGGAFRDRSAALRLPRVLVIADGLGAQRATGGEHPAAETAAGLPVLRRHVQAAVAASGADVVTLRLGIPDGYSADVSLQVARPAWFLQHRLLRLQSRLQALATDGAFISLFEADGRPLFVAGGSARLTSGLGGVLDPRYGSCSPELTVGGHMTLAPPLPCPSDWRPPASTPPRPPRLYGAEAGGGASGDWNGRYGITVPYRPGATLGVGFVLANPNGHPIVVESLAPASVAGAPIRYTGARIQVPRSRADPGTPPSSRSRTAASPPSHRSRSGRATGSASACTSRSCARARRRWPAGRSGRTARSSSPTGSAARPSATRTRASRST